MIYLSEAVHFRACCCCDCLITAADRRTFHTAAQQGPGSRIGAADTDLLSSASTVAEQASLSPGRGKPSRISADRSMTNSKQTRTNTGPCHDRHVRTHIPGDADADRPDLPGVLPFWI